MWGSDQLWRFAMSRIARVTKRMKTYATIDHAERAAISVGNGKDLSFSIAADTIANGTVRFYPIFFLSSDQFQFASILMKLGFHVVSA